MKKREFVAPFVLFTLACASIYSRVYLFSLHGKSAVAAEPKSKVLTAAEEARYRKISNAIMRTGRISDTDLQWMVSIIQSPALPGATPTEKSLRKAMCLGYLTYLKFITPAQKDKITTVAVNILSQPDPSSNGINYQFACRTIAVVTKDKKAIPNLIALRKDARPIIQKHAQHALELLGYKA